MKRKIVYISGAESFDIKDVKAAFEEVRNTLKLDSDTLLFGVPVEEFVSVSDETVVEKTDSVTPVVFADDVVPEQVVETVAAPIIEKPKKASRKKHAVTEEQVTENIESVADEKKPETAIENPNDTALPILSVLSSNTVPLDSDNTEADDVIKDDFIIEPIEDKKEEIQENQESEIISDEFMDVDETELVSDDIADMVKDDMPVDETEKTLEELLETMTPLREDAQPEIKSTDSDIDFQSDTSDTTLESLASEFVENQDNLLPPKKNAQRSKIGKLKNILPFKKMKREDPGIMGDLFGWAGIAANDEDFTMPGFFTGVASKK